MKSALPAATLCPCGLHQSYLACCGLYHHGEVAPSAESLMRSRYSAYVLGLEAYLLNTWHSTSRPVALNLTEEPPAHWLGLDVKRQKSTGIDSAIVEFIARYKINGRAHRLHETSRFLREEGRWYYLDGEFPEQDARR
ncbi:MAG: YchJ family metal-binding protein [Betaproteobacteria bacterium]